MKHFGKRVFNYYLLKPRYRWELSAPAFVGAAIAIGWLVMNGYDMQIERGLTPGAPLGSEPGSVSLLLLVLGMLAGLFLGGTILCMVIYTALLVVTRGMSWGEAFGVSFLSKYPGAWFAKASRERAP